MWRETTTHERNMRIWTEELADFVPAKVLDFHVHILNAATLPAGKTWSAGGHALTSYDFDDLRRDLDEFYPARQTAAVCFGSPDPAYDKGVNDGYVADGCDHERFFPLRLIDPAEDPDAVRRDVIARRFLGFKPYLRYVRKADPNTVEIDEMLPGPIMRIADDLGLIVMLHIPRRDRLADRVNQRQIVRLCTNYPRAKIVLAHIGRAYYLSNIVGHLDNLKGLPNLYYDLAMLNNWEVLEYLFSHVDADRILHATDTPIALAPGKSVEINDQYTYVTPVPWDLSICDSRGKLVFTSFLFEQLRATKKAVERLGLERQFVEGVFWDNGMKLLGETEGNVKGSAE
jgi:hypothetical protein